MESSTIDLSALARETMERYGFVPDFPDSVHREVDTLHTGVEGFTDTGYTNLCSLLWSSIDNEDSQDLDQVEYCERLTEGRILVRVAIADVDALVPKQSRTDRHAAHNGTSVYTGVVTFPLLPDQLSKGMTSLLPGEIRRSVVIEYTVLAEGDTLPGKIYPALVCNKAKLVYEEIGDWLEGTQAIPPSVKGVPGLEEQIHLQTEASLRMRKYRMDHGALDLETLEARAIVHDGRVADLTVQTENMARHLIEEFMIAANRTMVDFLGKSRIPMIQRIVRTPKYWNGIVMTAAMHGENLPARPDQKALSAFLERQRKADPARFPDLSLAIVKLLGPGEYVPLDPGEPPLGHFGLAITDYTHSTAPNRRYVDLIIQRLVKAEIEGKPTPYSLEELNDRSAWLTDREKASNKVERFMRKAAAAVLLQDRVGELFDAFVTGITEHGTYVRLIRPPAEGRIMRGEEGLYVGEKVRVRLIRTDPRKGYIDFDYDGKRKP